MFSAINQYSRKFNFEILRHTKPSATAIQKQYLRPPFEGMYWSGLCMQKLLPDFEVQTILYIGSGEGVHAQIFQDQGKTVTVIEYGNSIYFQKAKDTHRVIVEDFNQWKTQDKFECVWASHILKHQPNPNQFLKNIYNILDVNGVLAITIPPMKVQSVGGHLTLWNLGMLFYNLILAGFDCRNACGRRYDYNVSLILRKTPFTMLEIAYDSGDIELLAPFFPYEVREGYYSDITSVNWLL